MDDGPNLDDTPPPKRMKITTPSIHLLPNELLVKIIEKLPRSQWRALELVDPKFKDAILLAWGSVRDVDIDRDFIYSESDVTEDEIDDSEMFKGRLRLQIAQQTEAILKKLYERSPFITSLSGLLFNTDDPSLNTTGVQCLAKFEHLKTIKFAGKIYFSDHFVNSWNVQIFCDVPLINFIEFMELTQSRATLKEIYIDQCDIPDDVPIMAANFDQRLRAAFANDPNDPTRQLLQLESLSLRLIGGNYPLTFLDSIDGSRMTKLSFGYTVIEPAALLTLINGAPQLQHLDFAFLWSCKYYANTPACQEGRLQPNKDLVAALGSHKQLKSLGFCSIWNGRGTCACHRFEAEFKTMLRTIAPQLMKFVFKPVSLPPNIRMGEMRDIIQHHMPNLKSITLDARCAENPEDLRGIADGKELDEIEIAAFSINNNYEAILNEVISTILNKSPRLKKFNGVDYIPDQRVAVVLWKFRDLIDLRVQAGQLTEICFIAFSHKFAEKLRVLHLGRIGDGVESGLIELIAKATHLRELVVEEGNTTDRLLECVAKSCPNLEKFYASPAVGGMTLEGVQMLVDRCTKLRWLRVNHANGNLAGFLYNLKLDRYRKLERY